MISFTYFFLFVRVQETDFEEAASMLMVNHQMWTYCWYYHRKNKKALPHLDVGV